MPLCHLPYQNSFTTWANNSSLWIKMAEESLAFRHVQHRMWSYIPFLFLFQNAIEFGISQTAESASLSDIWAFVLEQWTWWQRTAQIVDFPTRHVPRWLFAFFLVLWFWSRMWCRAADKAAELKYTLSHRKYVCASLLKKVSVHRIKFGNLCRTGQQPAYFIIWSRGSNAFSSGLLIAWFWLMFECNLA